MELDADGEALMVAARKAYEAYAGRAGWKSLVTGDPLPQWNEWGFHCPEEFVAPDDIGSVGRGCGEQP